MKSGLCLMILACVAFSAAPAMAQDGMPPMGAPEQMKMLSKMDGTYDVLFKFKMDPAGEFQESKATATLSSVLGGACQKMEFAGNMMGMPFKGIGWTAYSRGLGKWQTTWVDNMNAAISYYTGDMKDGMMVFTGEEVGPDGHKMQSRMTTYNMKDNSFDWKMEMSMDGENYFTGAMATYTRRGGAGSQPSSTESDDSGW